MNRGSQVRREQEHRESYCISHREMRTPEAAQVCSKDGVPKKSGEEVLAGLYFCGFHVSPTGMLREIAIEAKRIARSVARV